jgi:transposase
MLLTRSRSLARFCTEHFAEEHLELSGACAGVQASLPSPEQGPRMPDNVTRLLLPPYSPELNPVENLWHRLRSHHLSNCAYRHYDDLLDGGSHAWRRLTPDVIKSVCRCRYLERAEQT